MRAVPKAFALPVALGGLVIAACGGDPEVGPPECRTNCVPLKSQPSGLEIENRTLEPVVIGIAERQGVRIDEHVVDGSLALPIPVVTDGFERRIVLEAGRKMTLNSQVAVFDGTKQGGTHFGAFVRLGNGPSMLALGFGRLLVRTAEDGTTVIDAEDPKVVSMSPAARSVPECAPGVLSPPFAPPPASFYQAARKEVGTPRVRAVVRGADGCRDIDIADDAGDTVANMHVCIPDDAYPFADGDDIRVFESNNATPALDGTPMVSTTPTTTMRFTAASGAELVLTRVVFGERTSADAEGLELTIAADDSCARIDERCGHVDVPARMTVRTSDGTSKRVVYGEEIIDPTRDRRFFVLAGMARPVAATQCTGDDDPGAMAPGRAWVATVIR